MNKQKNRKRYVLTPLGSYGDIRPMVALGRVLQNQGNDVLLVLTRDYAASCRGYNIPVVELDVEYENSFFRKTAKGRYKSLGTMHIIRTVNSFIDAQFKVLNSLLADNDVVISNSFGYAAAHAAEARNLPCCHIIYCSQLIPSTDYPPFYFPLKSGNSIVYRILWKMMLAMSNIIGRKPINRHRRILGMLPVKETYSYHFRKKVIIATDPEIDPVSKGILYDFPQVGYMHHPDDEALSPELEKLLHTDRHKVYFGLGSMINNDGKKIWNILTRLSLDLNIRFFVYGKGYRDIKAVPDSEVIQIKHAPHLKLFPEMSAVIHHGGSGTTHTAALAGVPQIIMPVLMDQPVFAAHIFNSGLGPKPLSLKQLNHQTLKQTLESVIGNNEMKNNCTAMANKLKARRQGDYAFWEQLV